MLNCVTADVDLRAEAPNVVYSPLLDCLHVCGVVWILRFRFHFLWCCAPTDQKIRPSSALRHIVWLAHFLWLGAENSLHPASHIRQAGKDLRAAIAKFRSTSCRRAGGRHDMSPPLSSPVGAEAPCAASSDGNVAAVSHGQHVPTPTAAAAWRANAVSKAAWWPWLLTFLTLTAVSRVTCDVGYLCTNFDLPIASVFST